MYLIDETYFSGDINIPNIAELQGDADTNLEYYVDERVRLLLQIVLGSVLFDDLDSNVTDGILDEDAPLKWLNLVNGCTYTKDGKDYVWKGLIYTQGVYPKSLLAYYVFYFWLENNVSQVLGVGEVRAEAKNAVSVNSTQRLVSSWNKFVLMYQGEGCNSQFYYHDGVPIFDWFGTSTNGGYVNLLQFLKDNIEDYPDTNLVRFDFKNQLGL